MTAEKLEDRLKELLENKSFKTTSMRIEVVFYA